MVSQDERLRRKSVFRQVERGNREDALSSLLEVARAFEGRSYTDLSELAGQLLSYKIVRGNRTYDVLVRVTFDVENQGALMVNFDVDDGGLCLFAPLNRWDVIRPGGRFEGF